MMAFFRDRFNLEEDKAKEEEIVAAIRRNISFRGTNLWTLIFAIMIASIGLNVNSTAVIIGAMLISPLMGPLMGIGLAVGTNDIDLLQKGIKNLTIASIISILTSALYFFISPIHTVNSELLARTTPSLFDVLIAFFGGLAGIVAGTRTQRGTVIPGVAIATALMPPLCTAGFGIATGQWRFFFGAIYLFFINSLLICVATFLIVKRLNFHKKEFVNKNAEKRVIRSIWIIVVLTIIPSIYLAYKIVEKSIFENNSKNFITTEFKFPRSQVISRSFRIDGSKKTIELLIVGQELSNNDIDSLKKRMSLYGLDSVRLIVHQGLNAKNEIDIAQIKASVLEEVFKSDLHDTEIGDNGAPDINRSDLKNEMKILFPQVETFSLSPAVFTHLDSTRTDTLMLLTAKFSERMSSEKEESLRKWMKERIKADSVRLLTFQ